MKQVFWYFGALARQQV